MHTYYAYGLIFRIALNKNIKVFTTQRGKIYQLNKKRQISNRNEDLKEKVNSLRKDQLEILKDEQNYLLRTDLRVKFQVR